MLVGESDGWRIAAIVFVLSCFVAAAQNVCWCLVRLPMTMPSSVGLIALCIFTVASPNTAMKLLASVVFAAMAILNFFKAIPGTTRDAFRNWVFVDADASAVLEFSGPKSPVMSVFSVLSAGFAGLLDDASALLDWAVSGASLLFFDVSVLANFLLGSRAAISSSCGAECLLAFVVLFAVFTLSSFSMCFFCFLAGAMLGASVVAAVLAGVVLVDAVLIGDAVLVEDAALVGAVLAGVVFVDAVGDAVLVEDAVLVGAVVGDGVIVAVASAVPAAAVSVDSCGSDSFATAWDVGGASSASNALCFSISSLAFFLPRLKNTYI